MDKASPLPPTFQKSSRTMSEKMLTSWARVVCAIAGSRWFTQAYLLEERALEQTGGCYGKLGLIFLNRWFTHPCTLEATGHSGSDHLLCKFDFVYFHGMFCCEGATVVQRLALSPHGKKVLGLNPCSDVVFLFEVACSPCVSDCDHQRTSRTDTG